MTPDTDNQLLIQWGGGLGLLLIGFIAAVWKAIRNSDGETDRERDDRERQERSKRYQSERELEFARLEAKFQAILHAMRESILGEAEKQHASLQGDLKMISERLMTLEVDVRVIKSHRQK